MNKTDWVQQSIWQDTHLLVLFGLPLLFLPVLNVSLFCARVVNCCWTDCCPLPRLSAFNLRRSLDSFFFCFRLFPSFHFHCLELRRMNFDRNHLEQLQLLGHECRMRYEKKNVLSLKRKINIWRIFYLTIVDFSFWFAFPNWFLVKVLIFDVLRFWLKQLHFFFDVFNNKNIKVKDFYVLFLITENQGLNKGSHKRLFLVGSNLFNSSKLF